jgi:hypothetical protein
MFDHVCFIVSEWKFQIRIRKFVLFSDEPNTWTLEALYFKVMFHEKHRQTWMRGTCLRPHVSTSKYTKRKLCFCLPVDLSIVFLEFMHKPPLLNTLWSKLNLDQMNPCFILLTLCIHLTPFPYSSVLSLSLSLIGVRWLGHVSEVLLTFLRVLGRRFV